MSRLGVARSGYYAWQQRQKEPGPKAVENAVITAAIQAVFQEHRGFYGSPRIHQELLATGRKVGRHRAARLMQRVGLRAKTRRAWRPCNQSASSAAGVAENLLQQDFQPPAPNRCWTGDITNIRTIAGCRYLAVWMDLFSRRVVGWTLGSSMEASLVLEVLHRALGQRQAAPEQLLIHSDQGSQYRASAYRELLEAHGITYSMSAKGCCWDNAVVENLFSTLKHELGLNDDADVLLTPQQLERDLAFWIEGYYNRDRRHSTLGYLSPIAYEQQFIATRTLASADS